MAISRTLRFEILRRDNHTCRYCGQSAPNVKLTVDHVLPVALGGTDEPTNLVAACQDCNGGKSATPPSSELVAQVDEDAIRWARARKLASERALLQFEAQTSHRREFESAWNQWTSSGRPIPLPPEWTSTVDRFLAAGLPAPILVECIRIAMRANKVPAESRFKYMCGVAWRKVSKIDRDAAELVNGHSTGVSGAADVTSVGELIELLIDQYGEERVQELGRRAEREGVPASELKLAIVRQAIKDFIQAEEAVAGVACQLDQLLHPRFRPLVDPEDPSEISDLLLLEAAVDQLADEYLSSLPAAEIEKWIHAAERRGIEPGLSSIRWAARYHGLFRRSRLIPSGLCSLPGDDDTPCLEASAFTVRMAACRGCRADCRGHDFCTAHATGALDGGMQYDDGTLVEIVDITDSKGSLTSARPDRLPRSTSHFRKESR